MKRRVSNCKKGDFGCCFGFIRIFLEKFIFKITQKLSIFSNSPKLEYITNHPTNLRVEICLQTPQSASYYTLIVSSFVFLMKPEDIKEAETSQLNQAQIFYLKRIEKENFDRVVKLKKMRQRNIWTGLGLAGSVFGIYLYSIFTVKQENFLDELDEKRV